MRPRLRRAAAALLGLALCSWPLRLAHPQQPFEDRLTLRGVYFREASTRVIQPMIEVTKALPEGFDVSAHFLVDDITSASVAQGVMTDQVFNERRYEGGVQAGRTLPAAGTRVSAFIRYSTEPDYKSFTGGAAITQEVWQRTGSLGLAVAATGDNIVPRGRDPKDQSIYWVGASYLQAFTPTTITQAFYEVFYQSGYFANPYISHPNLGRENLPGHRLRHATGLKAAQYIPDFRGGLQLHYRFYFDQESLGHIGPWGMTAHTIEGRLHKEIGRDVEARIDYRYHLQNAARFWCNSLPSQGGDIGCYGQMPEYHSVDPKFGDATTHVLQFKLMWDTRVFAGREVLDLLAGGTFEISYAYYFESTPYGMVFNDRNAPPLIGDFPWGRSHGGAHLIQTGYSLPF
jgi:hypothetical protein